MTHKKGDVTPISVSTFLTQIATKLRPYEKVVVKPRVAHETIYLGNLTFAIIGMGMSIAAGNQVFDKNIVLRRLQQHQSLCNGAEVAQMVHEIIGSVMKMSPSGTECGIQSWNRYTKCNACAQKLGATLSALIEAAQTENPILYFGILYQHHLSPQKPS